jgi:DNA primase
VSTTTTIRTDLATRDGNMDDTGKYLIRATITADGVVERSDVVGAVYGQTEGLLGDELDLRYLQRASKVGRLDVEIESENGRSVGSLEIDSGLDRPETAILAAALETIDQIGPCSATVEVVGIDDVRTAKRQEVADRAKELLESGFKDGLDPGDVVAEVRESARTGEITTYEGLPAGPRVATGDAIIVVEGRADVRRLLSFGIKNAIAVEGTDVPDAVATLSRERTTTALLDGDRGGELLLRELRQVAAIDHVAFVPEGRSVEDLERHEVFEALREKVPIDSLPEPTGDETGTDASTPERVERAAESNGDSGASDGHDATPETETDAGNTGAETLGGHVASTRDAGTVRLLDADQDLLSEAPMEEAFDAIETADPVPTTVVLDGTLTQRLLDVAAQRGVGQVIARETGEFAKQPADVRVRLAEEFELADA